jgi:hypothetical protein
MRALPIGLLLGLAGCFYTPEVRHVQSPTYAGRIGGVQFDRERVSGVGVLVVRTPDGVWVGHWNCKISESLSPVAMCPVSVAWSQEGLHVTRLTHQAYALRGGSVVVVSGPSEDTVFRRLDGQRIPEQLLVPMWIALQSAGAEDQGMPNPEASLQAAEQKKFNVPVEGAGAVEVRYGQPLLSALDWLDEGR